MAQPANLTTTRTVPTHPNSNVSGEQSGAVSTISRLSRTICANCGKEGGRRCTRCQEIFYCGQECQKMGWKVHKAICMPPNPFGGKASDLRRLMAPLPAEADIVCRFKDEMGRMTPLTQEEFREKTGITFTPYYRASQALISKWSGMNPAVDPFFQSSMPAFFPTTEVVEAFERDPPEVYLIPEPLCGGFGVAAGRLIKNGEIICYYAGEFRLPNQPRSFKSTVYTLNGVDPSSVGGIGSFVNDGPPNCVFTTIYNYRGMPQANILVADRDILKDEVLWTFYGDHHPIHEAPYEISPENFQKLKTYCLSGAFYDVSLKLDTFSYKIYILSRLCVFFRLLLEQALEGSKTKKVLPKPLPEDGDIETRLHRYRPKLIECAEYFLSLKNNALVEEICTSLLNGLRLLTFLQILSQMKEEGNKLTVERVKEYKILGTLTDYLYFLLNGTYIGTYHQANLLDQKPETPLDLPMVRNLHSQLSSELKERFKRQILAALEACSRQGWMEEVLLLTRLTQELYLG